MAKAPFERKGDQPSKLTPQQQATLEYRRFVERYRDDPVAFAEDVLRVELVPWQRDLMAAVASGKRRISVRAGRRVGKSAACSMIVVWFLATRYPQKTVITAPAAPQLFDVLYPEIKRWIGVLPPAIRDLFVVFSDRIVLKAELDQKIENSFVSAKTAAADRPEAMQGVHSENVLLIFDEAPGIPEAVYTAMSGSMAGPNAISILIGNPNRNAGLFFDTHHSMKANWFTMHVSCIGSPLVSPDFISDTLSRYGENSLEYRVHVLGEFPTAESRVLIAAELVDSAMGRDVALNTLDPIVYGVDVARFGDDRTVICKRQGNVVLEIKSQRGLDLMATTGWVAAEARVDRPAEIMVDSIGLGSGVADRLRELKFNVRDVNVAEATAMNLGAYRLRDELWIMVRDWLNTKTCRLPKDDELRMELVSTCYDYHSTGQYKIESKDAMKARMRRSPDLADALCLTFAGQASVVGGRAPAWIPGQPMKRGLRGVV